jgi:hypothetical protein
MADTIKIVDPDNGAGTDYTSLDAWEDATGGVAGGDVTATTGNAVAQCRSSSGAADTAQVDIEGWTTDATHRIRITAHADGGHSGVWSNSKYRLAIADANMMLVRENYIDIDGIQLAITSATAGRYFFQGVARTAPELFVSKCIIKGHGNASYRCNLYVLTSGDPGTFRFQNCTIYNFGANAGSYGQCGDSGVWQFYNCTCIWASGTTAGIRNDGAGSVTCYNTYSGGNTAGRDFFGTIGGDYNASSDTTAGGLFTHYLNSVAISSTTFNDHDSDPPNYHLGASSTLIDAGDGGSVKAIYTDDIDGDTRPATDGDWDIGADEYVAGTTAKTFTAQDALGSYSDAKTVLFGYRAVLQDDLNA